MANSETQKTQKPKTRNRSTTKQAGGAIEMKELASDSKVPIIPKNIDPTQYVVVRNGFQGRLIYKSKKTNELFIWDDFGSEQEIELRELKNAKNSYKKFFINNWFMFDEGWIVEYLGVSNYYKNAIKIEHFDDVFNQSPAELKKTISKLSEGQKKSLAYRAKELIAEDKIDSLATISVLEDTLGIELIER